MSNKKILVIEDDADVRLGYHILLKPNRYDTFFATDAVSAISEARAHQPDLIILDLGLPGGDGFVVMDRLRTNTYLSMVPVIVVSARDVHANKDRALKAGAKAYFQKPWDDDELLFIIDEELMNVEHGTLQRSPKREVATSGERGTRGPPLAGGTGLMVPQARR